MVRKTKEEAQQTYTALLNAAERIFCEKGVARTTLSDIAAAAGMTRGAIYWHFKDKAALFEAMCDRAFLPMQCLFNEIKATQDMDPLDALRQMITQMLILASRESSQRNIFNVILHHCEKNDETATFIRERNKRAECIGMFENVLRDAITAGKLSPATDTGLAAQAVNAFLIGVIYEWLMDPCAYELGQRAEMLTKMFFTGLLACPPLKSTGDAQR